MPPEKKCWIDAGHFHDTISILDAACFISLPPGEVSNDGTSLKDVV